MRKRTYTATAIRKRLLKLCYRCGGRFDPIVTNGNVETISQFAAHDAECLQRAIDSDNRKRTRA